MLTFTTPTCKTRACLSNRLFALNISACILKSYFILHVIQLCAFVFLCIHFLSTVLPASDVQAELEREMAADENVPAVKHVQQREYTGMFEYRKEDEPLLVRNLIIGMPLNPQ